MLVRRTEHHGTPWKRDWRCFIYGRELHKVLSEHIFAERRGLGVRAKNAVELVNYKNRFTRQSYLEITIFFGCRERHRPCGHKQRAHILRYNRVEEPAFAALLWTDEYEHAAIHVIRPDEFCLKFDDGHKRRVQQMPGESDVLLWI